MQSKSFLVNLVNGIRKRAGRLFAGDNNGTGLNWIKIKFLKHAGTGPLRTYAYKGKKIYYTNPPELLHTIEEIFVHEIYNISLPANAFIIDCGANIGLSTLYLKEHFPGAEIIAFEPDPHNFELLCRNIDSFGLQKVTPRNEAVWNSETELNFSGDGNMGSKITVENKPANYRVKAIRLKDMLTSRVDFLKMDIEGAEYEVLRDIAPALTEVKNLFVEYHGKFDQATELTEIFNLLTNAGFAYYIKEAANVYPSPFLSGDQQPVYDVQLNIFAFRKTASN